jgi:hypothetical protein
VPSPPTALPTSPEADRVAAQTLQRRQRKPRSEDGDGDDAAGGTKPDYNEVVAAAVRLGMDPMDDYDLLWIAEQAAMAPLPAGWEERRDQTGNTFYMDQVTGNVVRPRLLTPPSELNVDKSLQRTATSMEGTPDSMRLVCRPESAEVERWPGGAAAVQVWSHPHHEQYRKLFVWHKQQASEQLHRALANSGLAAAASDQSSDDDDADGEGPPASMLPGRPPRAPRGMSGGVGGSGDRGALEVGSEVVRGRESDGGGGGSGGTGVGRPAPAELGLASRPRRTRRDGDDGALPACFMTHLCTSTAQPGDPVAAEGLSVSIAGDTQGRRPDPSIDDIYPFRGRFS